MVPKQQKYWVPNPPQFQKNKQHGGRNSSHPPNPSQQQKYQGKSAHVPSGNFRPLSEVTFHKCGQKGHYSNKCNNQKRLPPPPPIKPPGNAIVKHNSNAVRVNMVNAAEAEDSSQVIIGNLSVDSIPTKVLFDTGASHSFMSKPFYAMHDFNSEHLNQALRVVSVGKHMRATAVILDVSIK